ncbi:hypothetical protein HPB49_013892 [Dermacentor silvarum]|uniref:Uncharacterized protein n=1 Tax=Dermacentor silvarum TaxID=543639 RepID=A0ACB8DDK3_DERSI|nr:hypothetical protein HPB49_013892 [Dermacentor silvarum]
MMASNFVTVVPLLSGNPFHCIDGGGCSQYFFRLVDVGAPGRFSDRGIFQDSLIGKRMHEGKLSLRRAARLPGRKGFVLMFVGDEAFQLRPDFMWHCQGTGLHLRR